ncbi:VIT1/CCC1 transporter family protein [Flavobacterium sp. W21_SRS_FM6]|uniref:VIT1/CCC1 transporter family protein n=1 Tax=Flavobacterium sp. W21_SRS_FM6 TaxID=3240268 RepID=UPI003F8FDF98
MEYNHEHKAERIGWIRAVVLGANDGIVSTASLVVGIAASGVAADHLFLVGLAALVAGAMSMAAGEYVSVSSQTDIERAELALEQQHLNENWTAEVHELATIYRKRGLDSELALTVAKKLMEVDPLGSHARDELGITELAQGNPLQAALFSALSFSAGAALPLITVLLFSVENLIPTIIIISLGSLVLLGGVSAHVGGASKTKAALRVLIWGALAMLVSMGIGQLFEVTV